MGVVSEAAGGSTDDAPATDAGQQHPQPPDVSDVPDPFDMSWDTERIKLDAEGADFVLSATIAVSHLFG